MNDVGSIIIVKNICFKSSGKSGLNQVDHAYAKGRPAVIIAEDEEYMYYLLISSTFNKKKNYRDVYFLKENNLPKKSVVQLKDIYRRRICGFQECGYVDSDEMDNMLKYFYYCQLHIHKDEYFDIVDQIFKQKEQNVQIIRH